MDRCPNCSARYRGGNNCRRCGMALGELLRIDAAAQYYRQQAVAALLAQDTSAARWHCRRALGMQEDRLTRALLGFVENASA